MDFNHGFQSSGAKRGGFGAGLGAGLNAGLGAGSGAGVKPDDDGRHRQHGH